MKRELAIIGAGYVGVPLAQVFAEAGVGTVLVDVDPARVEQLRQGQSYIEDVPSERLAPLVESGALTATTDYDAVRETDAVLIAVPTPLTRNREPDLSIVFAVAAKLSERLRKGHLDRARIHHVSRDDEGGACCRSSTEAASRSARTSSWPSARSGSIPAATTGRRRRLRRCSAVSHRRAPQRAIALYGRAIDTIVPVSSPDAAELVKLLENIFRSVNIALVNELAQLCDRMDLDVWEVIEAAGTKPFGFMRFEPGPGLGGHCLPVDPFYLSWKAREYDFYTEFIELAGKINENMPYFCLDKIARALNAAERSGAREPRPPRRGLLQGETSATARVARAEAHGAAREGGAEVTYSDPHVPALPEHGLTSLSLDGAAEAADCVVIVTAHDGIDYVEARRALPPRRRPAQRNRRRRPRERQGMEAVVGQVGLGPWGTNLARNFNELARLKWVCDTDQGRLDGLAARFPSSTLTSRFDDLLPDPEV